MSAVVAVLAGGRGRRMGTPKPLVELAGAPLIARPLAAAAAAGLPAVVVAKPDTPLPERLGVPVWFEDVWPVHPLLGIVTALTRAAGPVVAVGCDMPFVTGPLLARLAAGPEAVVRVAGRLEPLPARYETAWLPALRAALERQAPMRETLTALAPAVLDEGDDVLPLLRNVNTPADVAAARKELEAADDDVAGP